MIDPGSGPDALRGGEERPSISGAETEPRGCPEVLDDPARPTCDCEFPYRRHIEGFQKTEKMTSTHLQTKVDIAWKFEAPT